MSLFGYPRINFTGEATINVGTANNDDYSAGAQDNPQHPGEKLPPGQPFNSNPFRLSDSVNVQAVTYGMTDQQFMNWAQTPQPCQNDDGSAATQVPGEWNYFGDMAVSFDTVTVQSVTMAFGQTTTSNPLVGASLSFTSDEGGYTTALICDSNPEDVPASQIFADVMALRKNGTTYFSAQPTKAVTRYINFGRNPQLMPPAVPQPTSAMASATFQHGIPVANFSDPAYAAILSALGLNANSAVLKNAAGFVVRYSMYRCIPKQHSAINYPTTQAFADAIAAMYKSSNPLNPGVAIVSGSIGIWQKGELASLTMGRLMPATNAIPGTKLMIAPITMNLDTSAKIISLDISNSFPQNYNKNNNSTPNWVFGPVYVGFPRGGNNYQDIGEIPLDTNSYINSGGMIDISYKDFTMFYSLIEAGALAVYTRINGALTVLATETQYMIGSDQAIVYAEQNATSTNYRSSGQQLEPCKLRVYSHGSPFTGLLQVKQVEYSSTPNFNQQTGNYKTLNISDGYQVVFNIATPGSKLMLFMVNSTDPVPAYWEINLTAAFYINMRVLPQDDFSAVINSGNISWDFLYNNVLRNYNLLYPAMSKHLPFVQQAWEGAAAYVNSRVSAEYWGSSQYMPRTRDLSATRRALIQAWCKQFLVPPKV